MPPSRIEKYLVFVPNTFGPYGYEMVQVLGYPRGFHFRFRFDSEWVEEKVKNRLDDLVGRNGYILLRDFATSHLYPIRFVQVEKATKVGPVYYFECILREIMDVGEDDLRVGQFEDFRGRFDEFHPRMASENSPEEHLHPLVFLTNFEPNLHNEIYVPKENEDPDSSRWMNIVASTRDITYFENVEFLRILSLYEHPKDAASPKVKDGAWELQEGSTYTLQVVQFIPNGQTSRDVPNDIRVRADEAVIKVVRGEQRAVGKYDVLTFVVRVNEVGRSTFSIVDLEYRPYPELQERIQPSISLPIQTRRSPRRVVRRIFLTILFVGFYFFPNIAKYIPLVTEELVKDLGIVGLAVMVIETLPYLRKRGSN